MSVAKETIRRIQHVLARKGYNPGVIDGIWGRNTDAAVRAFQVDNGLVADGIVGATTSRALFGNPLDAEPFNNPAIPWFQEARRLIGVKEVVGPGNNPEIIDWASDAGIGYDDDDIPWCGLFVAHCVSSTLTSEPLPGNPLGARQWQKFGAPAMPTPGAILVFWRGSRDGWKGHVGFYAGEEADAYHVLGGNQGNSVSIARIRRDRLLEARWPATAPILDAGPVEIATGETMFSTNEA